MVKIHGQLEVEKMQAQADIALSDKKLQADLQKIAAELQLSREMGDMEMQQKRELHAMKMQEMRFKAVSDATKPQAGEGAEGEGGGGGHHDRSAMLVHHVMEQLHQMNKPKRMRKDADGSWISEPVH